MMDKRILDCEWMILRALWGKPPQTMGEIIAGVMREHPENPWKYKTYHSYLRVMLEKSLIGCDVMNAKEKRYFPMLTEEEALGQEGDTLLSRISNRSLSRMMAMMAEKGQLTEKDKRELSELFSRLNLEEGGEPHED
jgi:BlaI family transcriptional regulator, penicillinase repressor